MQGHLILDCSQIGADFVNPLKVFQMLLSGSFCVLPPVASFFVVFWVRCHTWLKSSGAAELSSTTEYSLNGGETTRVNRCSPFTVGSANSADLTRSAHFSSKETDDVWNAIVE